MKCAKEFFFRKVSHLMIVGCPRLSISIKIDLASLDRQVALSGICVRVFVFMFMSLSLSLSRDTRPTTGTPFLPLNVLCLCVLRGRVSVSVIVCLGVCKYMSLYDFIAKLQT